MRDPRKWISGLILAALVLLGFWSWKRLRPAPQPPSAKIATTPPAAPWPRARAAAAPDTSKQGAGSAQIEVCGVGKIKVNPDDITGGYGYVDALTEKSQLRWLAALRNSDDYRARATGLYLQNIFDPDAPGSSDALNELVQLAIGTVDPAVYALAYSKCNKQPDSSASSGVCQQLSAVEWTRRDPDNAVPWLLLAAKARQANDLAAEAAAFAHVANAPGYDSYDFSLLAFAASETPGDATPLEKWSFAVQIIGIEAAMPAPIGPYLKYCSVDGVRDPTVRQQCAALAGLLVAKGRTVLDLLFAATLGSRVGWPADRVNGLKQRINATMGMIEQVAPAGHEELWSCEAAARGNAYIVERVRLGELGAAQELIERSGESIPELARKHLELLEELERTPKPYGPKPTP